MALSLGVFNQLKQQEDQKRMIGYSCLRSRSRRDSQSPPLNRQISELGLWALPLGNTDQIELQEKQKRVVGYSYLGSRTHRGTPVCSPPGSMLPFANGASWSNLLKSLLGYFPRGGEAKCKWGRFLLVRILIFTDKSSRCRVQRNWCKLLSIMLNI